jgi:hypothetical protein
MDWLQADAMFIFCPNAYFGIWVSAAQRRHRLGKFFFHSL